MRKSAIFAVALVLSVGLSSCTKNESKAVTLPETYTVTAKISDGDFTAEAKLTRREGGWEVEMLSPDNLKGMEITLTEQNRSITYEELSFSANNEDLPNSSPISLTTKLLEKAEVQKPNGEIYGCEYEIKLKDGKPKSATLGDELSVSFEKITE